jgi:gamma-glutamylcyclotransferase (GGCT)/AIG2-like uncharacterized protein YtfP
MKNIFVYGTLLFPEILEKLTGKTFESKEGYLNDSKRYQIFDDNIPRKYPAIIESKGNQVFGKIILNVDQESLNILDYFEDEKYESKTLKAYLKDGEEFEVLVYVWREEFRDMLKGDWNIDYFKDNYLSIYLNEIIPRVLNEYKN